MSIITKIKDLPNKCLFFGYGSLMFPEGINGRGLKHIYRTQNELIPITIKGLKRSMSAEVYIRGYAARFYSVERNVNSKVFGMLFKIHSKNDLIALLINEGAKPLNKYGCYKTDNITKLVNSKQKLPILTLTAPEIKDNPKLYYPGYISYVFNGIRKKYRDEFLKTGGIYPK